MSLGDMDEMKRKMRGMKDSRSTQGIMSRGKNVYPGGARTGNSGPNRPVGGAGVGGGGSMRNVVGKGASVDDIIARFMAQAPRPQQVGLTQPTLGGPAPANPAAVNEARFQGMQGRTPGSPGAEMVGNAPAALPMPGGMAPPSAQGQPAGLIPSMGDESPAPMPPAIQGLSQAGMGGPEMMGGAPVGIRSGVDQMQGNAPQISAIMRRLGMGGQ